ncbi:MAG TPA: CoA-acylating methylmalonate-semialdehyde dehydrogenase [Bryobacteraceae bacterium]|nr:CoA-acylating methylmalonate-semialdehyde dehydrogenase [Bryobacteraceae bacterium]
MHNQLVPNYIGAEWRTPAGGEQATIENPATGEPLARVSLGSPQDVAAAVDAAAAAFPEWRRTPPGDRIQFLFRLKDLLEAHFDEIARMITRENGKTLAEAKGELRRGIENVETACGIPALMQGRNLEDVARGIDETMIRQPLGVVSVITPFNFPSMIPLWFLPYAIACGNTLVVKPSERVPSSMRMIMELIIRTGLPSGVVNLVNGGKAAVDALLDHPDVRAISFVGSTPVARYIYARSAANGKRVQAQGGAKNHVVIMPDADIETASQIVADSAFGCAGQRCLAVSAAITVGDAHGRFRDAIAERARALRVGNGLEEGVQMGPVITAASRTRIEGLIAKGVTEGARPLQDGRGIRVPGGEGGHFVGPTVLEDLPASSDLNDTEIFGPVLSLTRAQDLDQAIGIISRSAFGNASSIFTSDGAAARTFRYQAPTGNVGVNIGIAAPMAYFPFSGWRQSFFGTLHGQGRDGVAFFTEQKVVIERWPKEWSRKF